MLTSIRSAFSVLILVFCGLASGSALAEHRDDGGYSQAMSALKPARVSGTIVDVAVSNPNFSTLVTALTAADLVTTLQGSGPFTVFAPTNDAFARIPAPVLNYLLSNPDVLKQVLLYHVAPRARDLRNAFWPFPVTTVQGQKVFARVDYKPDAVTLTINNSTVILRPIRADNGIIYVIDSVLLPQFR
jgi:uncharacterized surface protein with fasciclin (FAS1) repeats